MTVLEIAICALITIVIIIKLFSENKYIETSDRILPTEQYSIHKSIFEALGEDGNKRSLFMVLGLSFVTKAIYAIDGQNKTIRILSSDIIKSSNGEHPMIQTYIKSRDLYEYDILKNFAKKTTSNTLSGVVKNINIVCSNVEDLCNVKEISNTLFNSAHSNNPITRYIWYDNYTKESVITRTISIPCGKNKNISTSYTEYVPSMDELFKLIKTYPSGIIDGDPRTPQINKDYNDDKYISFMSSTNFSTNNVLKNINMSGDNALVSYGYIFTAIYTIIELGGIKEAIEELNRPQVLYSLIDKESGRYLFILSHNKLTEKYTVLLHNTLVYRNMEVKEQEELILKQVICGVEDVENISCDITQNELYRTYKRLRQGSGALKMFDVDDNILDYIYMDFVKNKLVNKKSVFVRYKDPEDIHIDYVIGSGWTESILHAEK